MTIYHYLIIGNGAAGLSAAEMIRKRDQAGRITIVTDEKHLFYSRPGIAYYLNGQVSAKQLISRQPSFYEEHRFDLQFGHIEQIDHAGKQVFFRDGRSLTYDIILLATGASAVPPPFPGKELDGVITFDNLDDATNLIKRTRRARTAVVVGGGITAMELAEGLRLRGVKTHLLQRRDRIWSRLFDEKESAIIEHQIKHEGIELHYNEEIEGIVGQKGKVVGVNLASGRYLKCGIVAVAIGVRPNLKLVSELPLERDRGILVDAHMRSNLDHFFAAGDVAQVLDRWTGQHNLDVLWPSAINEGRAAGYNMVDVAHSRSPSFTYQKGSPFNAAMLFGLHLTVIGRVGGQPDSDQIESSDMSRGSSNVWLAPFTTSHRSAWDKEGTNSVRIVMQDGRLVGALLLGNQDLADPLRVLIEKEADLTRYQDELLQANAEGELPQKILKVWRDWHQPW